MYVCVYIYIGLTLNPSWFFVCSCVVLFLSCGVLWCCGVVLVVSCVVLFVLCVCVCDLFLFTLCILSLGVNRWRYCSQTRSALQLV